MLTIIVCRERSPECASYGFTEMGYGGQNPRTFIALYLVYSMRLIQSIQCDPGFGRRPGPGPDPGGRCPQ